MRQLLLSVLICAIGLGLLPHVLRWHATIHQDIEDRHFALEVAPMRHFGQLLTKVSVKIGLSDVLMPSKFLLTIKNVIYPSGAPAVFPGVKVEELYFSGIRVKVYTLESATSKPKTGFVYLHGGGFVFGSPESYHFFTGKVTEMTGVVLVSIDYRKAPAHTHPVALEDSQKATEYFLDNCYKRWGVDPHSIVIGGDSVGGLLATKVSLSLMKQNSKYPKPVGVVLVYPVTQFVSFNTPSFREFKDDFSLSRDMYITSKLVYFKIGSSVQQDFPAFQVNNFTTHAMRKDRALRFQAPELMKIGPEDMDSQGDSGVIERAKAMVEASSLFDDFSNFPPTLIISSKYDILRDDGFMLARRLQEAKTPVHLSVYDTYHGFLTDAPAYKPAMKAINEIVNFVKKLK